MRDSFRCVDCGNTFPVQKEGGTGYACVGKRRRKICYGCAGKRDLKQMRKTGKIILYFTETQISSNGTGVIGKVGNWPGTVEWNGIGHRSWHNFAGKNGRTDVWFVVHPPQSNKPERWHGVNIGDNQILRCRRVKN